MRRLNLASICLALVGCSPAPDQDALVEEASSAEGLAFAYRYDFRLPSNRIAAAQESHAQACEKLMPVRCRITGTTYQIDGAGKVAASLEVRLAAPIARAFGRRGVQSIEAAGGALTGAEFTGTDATPEIETAVVDSTDASTDLADIEKQLARADLTPAVRSDLLTRRAELLRAQRESNAAATAARMSVSTTPVSFTYTAGNGVGLLARLSDAAYGGYLSLIWTISTLVALIAYLAPPLMVLSLLAFLWRRFGRRWWALAFSRAAD